MRRAVLFLSLVSVLLLASCQPAPQAVDDRPLTVTPTADAGPQTVTASPTTDDQRLTTPTPTEAPLTLDTLGIPPEAQPYFQGVENAITRRVNENGEVIFTTTATFWDGEKKIAADYIIEQGTFNANLEIYDDLTRPLTVQAYRQWIDGELIPVTLLWQGPERGFREAFNLTAAYDPELKQVENHPYLHIVHADKPINSIDDLPTDDERLTLLNSIRYEQAKAIRALQVIREKLQNGQDITAQDLQGSVFLRPLQEKLRQGEKISEDDLYILYSPKAVEKWDAGGGLSLLFEELQEDGSKWVHLKAKGDDQPNQTYDSLNMKLTPLWFYTQDEEGNRHDMAIIAIMDADDVDRYNAGDPFGLQGKFVLAEELNSIDLTQEYQPVDFTQAYKTKKPLSPWIYVHAEGPILDRYPRLSHLLSLPDNNPGNQPFLAYPDENGNFPYVIANFYPEGFERAETHPQKIAERPIAGADIYDENGNLIDENWAPLPSTFQLLELMFDVRTSY